MKDKNTSAEEIKKFQNEIKQKGNAVLNQKRDKLYNVALRFADKNEIKYSKGLGGKVIMQF